MISQFLTPLVLSLMINVDAPKNITLQEGLDNGLIQVELTSLGGYTGRCVSIHVESTSNKKYQIVIEPGDVFIPNEDGDQNILVVEEQILAMDDVRDDFKIEGFCCEASDHSPGEGAGFSYHKIENDNLLQLANYISGKGVSEDNKQAAIWSVSDGESISEIYPSNKESKELRKFVCGLTGQEDVWFNTKKSYQVSASREIVSEPVLITGEVKYKVESPGKIYCSVYDAEGNVMIELVKGSKIPYASDLSFEFQGKVKGWDAGDYFVKVFLDEKEIHVQKFTV
ncbi:MAG: hypothetical protein H6599_10865 [Flavobacteriales bacterium]|nr:hypothetical protein [Flavobacteriales bacterium]